LLALRPLRLGTQQRARVGHAVGERLPTAHRRALAVVLGNKTADRRHVIEELDDDARVVERGAVVEQQRRDLTERIVRDDGRVRGRHVDQLEITLDALLREDDPHLAPVRAGQGNEQLHAW
jgi:hypothetical protein